MISQREIPAQQPTALRWLRSTTLICATACCTVSAAAVDLPVELYGKLNVSRDEADTGASDWVNNDSRIGLKGEYQTSGGISVVYQVERGVDPVHGGTHIDTLLSTRNTYVGVKGAAGTFFFGAHDTPFKKSQGKIDLFNDTLGDIREILVGDVRARDSFGYHSPALGALKVQYMHVPSDSNFGASNSLSVAFEQGDLYLAVAIDSEMRKNERSVSRTRVYDSVRGTAQYTPGNWSIGAAIQRSEHVNAVGTDSETGFNLSASYRAGPFTLKGQYGASDIVAQRAGSLLLGVDWKVASSTRVFAYYWDYDESGFDDQAVSLGLEFKF
jgi:predicted porin